MERPCLCVCVTPVNHKRTEGLAREMQGHESIPIVMLVLPRLHTSVMAMGTHKTHARLCLDLGRQVGGAATARAGQRAVTPREPIAAQGATYPVSARPWGSVAGVG